jgi:hypothetical protein
MKIVFAWSRVIVVCWVFSKKGHGGTFWCEDLFYILIEDFGYLSVYTYLLIGTLKNFST